MGFISVLDNDYSDSKKQRIQENLDSINSVYGMLSPEESKAVEDSVHAGIQLLDIIII
ncbi:MAG: hypothetical protein MR852_12970 [Treponema sp.]|nr:hypothetical protein [Treponema sp.]